MPQIRIAESDEEIDRAFPVMVQLRPHLVAGEFVERVRRQQKDGYRLAYLADDAGEVRSVAGFRVFECLHSGRTLYVDDLVTDAASRSKGHGEALFEWLVGLAKWEGCSYFTLDSGVQRFDAHRFYLRNRMIISSHHFQLPLTTQ